MELLNHKSERGKSSESKEELTAGFFYRHDAVSHPSSDDGGRLHLFLTKATVFPPRSFYLASLKNLSIDPKLQPWHEIRFSFLVPSALLQLAQPPSVCLPVSGALWFFLFEVYLSPPSPGVSWYVRTCTGGREREREKPCGHERARSVQVGGVT